MKKILHISDIHASCSPTKGQEMHILKKLKEAFLKDIDMLNGVDSIIISGDLTYSSKNAEFKLFDAEILQPIKSYLQLDNDKIIFSPGNHDIDRNGFSYSQKKAIESLREKYTSEEVDSLQDEILHSTLNPCLEWNEYINEFYKESYCKIDSNQIFQTYSHGDVGVVCLNTGWSAIGKNDKENLFIGKKQINIALKKIKNFKDKLIVLHHPFDWLHPEERKILTSEITRNGVSAVFYGHMHEFNILRESSFSEDFVMKLQAGRFDLSGSGNSGYSLISLDHTDNLKSGMIFFRRYNKETNSFVAWEDRCPGGEIKYESIPSQGFNRVAFSEDCKVIFEKYDFDLMCNTGVTEKEKKRLTEIFICPAITLTSYVLDKQNDEKHIDFEELEKSRKNMVIIGGENSGKSTILKRLLINKLSEQSNMELDEIVFYLDCREIKISSKHRMKSDLVEIYESAPNSDLYIDILKNKTITENSLIILDGVDELSTDCLNEVIEFVKSYKQPRFIFSCKHTVAQEFTMKLRKNSASDFVELNIGGMKRSHLKDLIGKWQVNNKEYRTVAKEILKAVDNAGMPNNLFVYSMLLSIYERKQGNFSTYLHEADLVENFIEVIMHKHCVTNKRAPQYKDLLRLLGSIAENMIKENKYILKCSFIDKVIVDFNANISQDFSVDSYLNPILSSGVIEHIDGFYRFSQVCFFDYVYARYLSTQRNNYSDLHSQLNFLRFNKVVEYLSAISKSDIELLDFCRDLTDDAWNRCTSSEKFTDLKSAEEELELAAQSDILDELEDEVIGSSFNKELPKEHEIDDELDHSSPLRTNAQNGEYRAEWDHLNEGTLFLSSLSLYARVFRAAEHLTDKESADKHFDKAMDFYKKTIALHTRKFHEQLRPIVLDKLIAHSHYKKLSQMEKERMIVNFNAVLNFIVAAFPNFTVSMMVSDLINARQINRFKNKKKTSTQNLEKIIISYSLCELEEVDTLSELKSIVPKKSYEYSSLIMKLLELSHTDSTLSQTTRNDLMKHCRVLAKNRKARKLVNDMSKITTKIADELLDN